MNRVWLIIAILAISSLSVRADEKLKLDDFLKRVESLNLDLKIEHSQLQSARSNAIGIDLPAPMAGYIRSSEDGGASAKGFELSQTIPFPTKIYSDKKIRNLESDSHAELHSARRSEILAKARLAFIAYWVANEKVSVLESRKADLLEHLKLARAGARSDSSMKIHLLRAESDIDLLENDITEAKQNGLERRSEVAVYLGGLNSESLPLPAEPQISNLMANPSESHPLKVARAELQVYEAKSSEAYQAWLPDLLVRYKQMTSTPTTAGFSEIMIGGSVPFVFPWEPYRRSRVANEEENQFRYRFEKTKLEFEASKNLLFSRASSYKAQLQNLESKILPNAHKRMELIHGIASRDMESLQDHRETLEIFSELRLKALDLRFEYEKTVAELAKLYGDNHE